MTQFARPTLSAPVDDGITLSVKFNGAMPALYTNHAGAAAPPSPEKGQMWVDTSQEGAATPTLALRQFTGSVWREIGLLNLTTGLFSTAGGLSLTGGTVTGPIMFPSGTALLPSITFAGDTNTGIYRVSADNIGFTTAGVERVRLSSAGLVLAAPLLSVTAASASVDVQRTLGTAGSAQVTFRSGTSLRWKWYMADAESTGNAGANLYLQNYQDDGVTRLTYLHFGRQSRQMGINGATVADGVVTIRTNAEAAHEDALEVMNTTADINGSVGINFRTASGALRGAIRGERPGNNDGRLSFFNAVGGVLRHAASFHANGEFGVNGPISGSSFWTSGYAYAAGTVNGYSLGNNAGDTAMGGGNGNGLYLNSAYYDSGVYFQNVALGNPAVGHSMGITNVHVAGQYAEVRVMGAGLYWGFNSSGAINRNDGWSVQFNPPSDARIKRNIAPTQVDALATLGALEVVQFNWMETAPPAPAPASEEETIKPLTKANLKSSGAFVPLGFVAQQVGSVVPAWETITNVMPEDPNVPTDLHGVDQAAMVPYLVRAIQQQQELIVALQNRLGALEKARR
jgi:hypothetical protein